MGSLLFKDCIGFDWDEANKSKSKEKHRVAGWECEQAFFNSPFIVSNDLKHSVDREVLFFRG